MRILSLGFPLPGAPIDNHTFANAPTFFDYDAIVVDTAALSRLIEQVVDGSEEHTTRSGDRIVRWQFREVSALTDLRPLIRTAAPGRKVAVEVVRGGKRQEFEILVGER